MRTGDFLFETMNVRFEVLLLQPMLEASLVILYCDCAGGDSVCPLFGWFLVGSTLMHNGHSPGRMTLKPQALLGQGPLMLS